MEYKWRGISDYQVGLPLLIWWYYFFPEACGKDCYLRQGVTVGANGRGGKHLVIGNHVEFGANP